MEINIFEYATRKKLRFAYKGQLTVEDLWDLPLVDLDNIYKQLRREMKNEEEESLMATAKKLTTKQDVSIKVVEHIFSVKVAEAEARKQTAENKAKREKLMSILAEREEKKLHEMSEEDLRKMIAETEV